MATTGSNKIELRAVCSTQLRTKTNQIIPDSGVIPWTVDASKPFGDETNLRRFATMLDIQAPLELCNYYEGSVGDVIDLSATPQQLAYRPRMSVLVRLKKVRRQESTLLPPGADIALSNEEEVLLQRLRRQLPPYLGPDDPCPVCQRTDPIDDAPGGGQSGLLSAQQSFHAAAGGRGGPVGGNQQLLAGGGSGFASGNFSPFSSPGGEVNFGVAAKADVGIQCGNAGRTTDDPIPVYFGSSSRFKEASLLGGSTTRGGSTTSGGGFSGRDMFDDAAAELKRALEDTSRERDFVKRQLEDMRMQKAALERWKADHRCDGSTEVAKLLEQNKMLHTSLREVMRGREEVFARLHERRTAGSMLTDLPHSYTPFAVSVPAVDASPTRRPESLLAAPASPTNTDSQRRIAGAMSEVSGFGDELPPQLSTIGAGGADVSSSVRGSPAARLARRPSGAPTLTVAGGAASGGGRPSGAMAAMLESANHLPGQCLLRVASSSGEPFFVRRRVASQIREGGHHVFALLSLDGVLTDEVVANELETCGTDGPTGLLLSTANNDWALYMAPSERAKWLSWFYALNPFLSAQQSAMGSIPNSF